MNDSKGVALITALIVLVATGALAVGAFFLTGMSLDIARNTRSNIYARANAESSLESAYVVMHAEVSATGEFPASIVTADVPGATTATSYRPAGPHEVLAYEAFADGAGLRSQARIEVRGFGPDAAEHDSEMLLEIRAAPGDPSTNYTYGVVTKNIATVENGVTINGNLHGDLGYVIEGAGITITGGVTSSGSWTTCKSEGITGYEEGEPWCDGEDDGPTNQVEPLDIEMPDVFTDYWIPQQAAAPVDVACPSGGQLTQSVIDSLGPSSRFVGCDLTISGVVTIDGKAIWVDGGGLSINGATITNSQLAADDIWVAGDTSFDTTDLFALTADRDPAMKFEGDAVTFAGDSTMASVGDILFEDQSTFDCEDLDADGLCDCLVTLEGCAEITGLYVVSNQDIKFENDTSLIGVFVAGGTFIAENETSIIGGVVAFGEVTLENTWTLYDPKGLSNGDLTPTAGAEVAVMSRR